MDILLMHAQLTKNVKRRAINLLLIQLPRCLHINTLQIQRLIVVIIIMA